MTKSLDWDHLRVFLAALRAGSLRGASEALGVNHATVNRAIRGLEDSLGTRVFDRSAEGLTLTQPGELLIAQAEEVERQTQIIGRRLTGLDATPTGTVRVSIAPSLAQGFLAPILAGFSAEFPDISIQIIATNQVSDLARHEADVSIRVAHEVSDDVVGRRLTRYALGVFAAPAYLERIGLPMVGDGTGAHWIGWREDHSWVAESPYPKARVSHILPEVYMQAEAAANGLGLIWVPVFLGDQHAGLVRVPGAPVQLDRSIWILLHGDLRRTARVRAFVDFATAQVLSQKQAFVS